MLGPDGYTPEFYKRLAPLLVPNLTKACNYVRQHGRLHPSWRNATISVIPKPNLDHLQPKSFRPISLLNTDFKILTSTVAHRLNTFIDQYIEPDQVGFIPNRDISDNTIRTLYLMHRNTQFKKPVVNIAIDIEKAFDTIEPSYLFSVLQKMDFGSSFLNIFTAIYSNPEARLLINNCHSKSIKIERGTRQGCPMSPLLFAVGIEPLARAIRENANIHGIVVGDKEHKIVLFADDILLTLTDPVDTLKELKQVISTF